MKDSNAAASSRRSSVRRQKTRRIRRRLSADLYLSLMALFTLLACVALLPFFFYRLANGEMAAAFGNGAVVLFLIGAFAYAWIRGETLGARRAIAVFMALGCVYMIAYVGNPPYWVFPILVANFLIVGWRLALTVNVSMVLVTVLTAPVFERTVEIMSFLTSITLVALFAMSFVLYTNFHRDRLSAMVERDPLTGALNRRALSGHLEEALASAGKIGYDHALAVMDLDDFKQINDLYGHHAGDRVLVDFSKRVMQVIRRGDMFYRLGGEEFVLLLGNTDREGAEVALNKLHSEIREALTMDDGPVTVSIGVALGRARENWSEWLARADHAMYQAKRDGKDRVVFAD